MACASTLNTVLMRNHELTGGIEVVDDKGNVVGTSKIAAKKVSRNRLCYSNIAVYKIAAGHRPISVQLTEMTLQKIAYGQPL